MDMLDFVFDNPTKLLFGSGKLKTLHQEKLPGKKALLLMSAGSSAIRNGSYDQTVLELKKAGISFYKFAKITENPLDTVCEEGGACAASQGCDFIVALGGGAVLDASVAVAVMATNPGRFWDYVQGGTGKGMPILHKPLPIVTIATTSGTGSEINDCGVICREETQEKIGFENPELLKPVIAVVDPLYMCSVPPQYTAFQGFDALFHHMEAMLSNRLNLLTETIALSSIRLIARYLPSAVRHGSDLGAREHVAYAATMAGYTMQLTGTIAPHPMEHAMSAYHRNLPHGAGLILISDAFIRFLIDRHVCEDRFMEMANAMGVPMTISAQDFADALVKLKAACGVGGLRMEDYGIKKEECLDLAKKAMEMSPGHFRATPWPLTVEEVAGIFEASF